VELSVFLIDVNSNKNYNNSNDNADYEYNVYGSVVMAKPL